MLLDANTVILAQDWGTRTALCHAVENGDNEVIKVLLEANVDTSTQDWYRRIVLHCAAMNG